MAKTIIERNLSSILSNEYVLEVHSGTAGLIISLLFGKNKINKNEVIIPSICCPAVLTAINFCNLKPVFVDMEKEYFNMDVDGIKSSINNNTLAIIGVHSYGIALDLSEIQDSCEKNNILLIEDCCLAIGGISNNKEVGSSGDISIFSFGKDKIISAIGGGMSFKNEEEYFYSKKLIEENNLFKCPAYSNEEMQRHFDNLDENINNRRKIVKIYNENITNPRTIKPSYRKNDVYWRYPLLIEGDRNNLINKAKENNLIITYHYPSLANFQYGNNLSVSEEFNNSVINLFVNLNTNDEYVEKVCNVINEYE